MARIEPERLSRAFPFALLSRGSPGGGTLPGEAEPRVGRAVRFFQIKNQQSEFNNHQSIVWRPGWSCHPLTIVDATIGRSRPKCWVDLLEVSEPAFRSLILKPDSKLPRASELLEGRSCFFGRTGGGFKIAWTDCGCGGEKLFEIVGGRTSRTAELYGCPEESFAGAKEY